MYIYLFFSLSLFCVSVFFAVSSFWRINMFIIYLSFRMIVQKTVSAALKAKAKAWTFEAKAKAIGVEVKGQGHKMWRQGEGLASRTTSLVVRCCIL